MPGILLVYASFVTVATVFDRFALLYRCIVCACCVCVCRFCTITLAVSKQIERECNLIHYTGSGRQNIPPNIIEDMRIYVCQTSGMIVMSSIIPLVRPRTIANFGMTAQLMTASVRALHFVSV